MHILKSREIFTFRWSQNVEETLNKVYAAQRRPLCEIKPFCAKNLCLFKKLGSNWTTLVLFALNPHNEIFYDRNKVLHLNIIEIFCILRKQVILDYRQLSLKLDSIAYESWIMNWTSILAMLVTLLQNTWQVICWDGLLYMKHY